MKAMTYKGYSASVAFDAEDEIFTGHIAGINDVIGFRADSVDGLESAFREAVDDYLEICRKTGKQPEKAFSGQVTGRPPSPDCPGTGNVPHSAAGARAHRARRRACRTKPQRLGRGGVAKSVVRAFARPDRESPSPKGLSRDKGSETRLANAARRTFGSGLRL